VAGVPATGPTSLHVLRASGLFVLNANCKVGTILQCNKSSQVFSHLLINTTTKVYRNGREDDIGTIKITVEILCLKKMPQVPPVPCILSSHVLQVSTHHWLPSCDFCCRLLSQYHNMSMGEDCKTHRRFYSLTALIICMSVATGSNGMPYIDFRYHINVLFLYACVGV
jgi:hypothetical protein